jgi:hypothetical protein
MPRRPAKKRELALAIRSTERGRGKAPKCVVCGLSARDGAAGLSKYEERIFVVTACERCDGHYPHPLELPDGFGPERVQRCLVCGDFVAGLSQFNIRNPAGEGWLHCPTCYNCHWHLSAGDPTFVDWVQAVVRGLLQHRYGISHDEADRLVVSPGTHKPYKVHYQADDGGPRCMTPRVLYLSSDWDEVTCLLCLKSSPSSFYNLAAVEASKTHYDCGDGSPECCTPGALLVSQDWDEVTCKLCLRAVPDEFLWKGYTYKVHRGSVTDPDQPLCQTPGARYATSDWDRVTCKVCLGLRDVPEDLLRKYLQWAASAG